MLVALAASIALNATTIPHLGWVRATVTLSSPATADVFLAVHLAGANVSRIPPQPYPAEAPWTASAAQKCAFSRRQQVPRRARLNARRLPRPRRHLVRVHSGLPEGDDLLL